MNCLWKSFVDCFASQDIDDMLRESGYKPRIMRANFRNQEKVRQAIRSRMGIFEADGCTGQLLADAQRAFHQTARQRPLDWQQWFCLSNTSNRYSAMAGGSAYTYTKSNQYRKVKSDCSDDSDSESSEALLLDTRCIGQSPKRTLNQQPKSTINHDLIDLNESNGNLISRNRLRFESNDAKSDHHLQAPDYHYDHRCQAASCDERSSRSQESINQSNLTIDDSTRSVGSFSLMRQPQFGGDSPSNQTNDSNKVCANSLPAYPIEREQPHAKQRSDALSENESNSRNDDQSGGESSAWSDGDSLSLCRSSDTSETNYLKKALIENGTETRVQQLLHFSDRFVVNGELSKAEGTCRLAYQMLRKLNLETDSKRFLQMRTLRTLSTVMALQQKYAKAIELNKALLRSVGTNLSTSIEMRQTAEYALEQLVQTHHILQQPQKASSFDKQLQSLRADTGDVITV